MRTGTVKRVVIAINILSFLLMIPMFLDNSFVFDDPLVLTGNQFTHSLKNVRYLFSEMYFYHSGEHTYRPLVTFSYMIDHALWGLEPCYYRLTNGLLHLTAALLFAAILMDLLKSPLIIILASGIFALAAPATEVLVSPGFREDILSAIFIFLTILFFIRGKSSGHPRLMFTTMCVSAILALLSKENAVILPIAVAFIAWVLRYPWKYAVRRVFALSLIVIGFLIMWFSILDIQSGIHNPNATLPVSQRLLTAPALLGEHLRLSILPWPLCTDHPPVHWSLQTGLFAAILCVGLITGLVPKKRYGAGLFLFVLALLPVINIYPPMNMAFAERYLYLPLAGFSLAAASVIADLRNRVTSSAGKWIIVTTGTLVLLILPAVIRFHRMHDWRNNIALWQSTVKTNPKSAMGWYNLAVQLKFIPGQRRQAWKCQKKAYNLDPDNSRINSHYALMLNEEYKPDQAEPYYLRAIELDPDNFQAHAYLGLLYANRKDYEKAIRQFLECMRINPHSPYIRRYLIQAEAAYLNK